MPEDLQRFRQITNGHPVIIAEATFAAIFATLGTQLPNRVNIVVSQKLELEENNGVVVSSLEEGLKVATELDQQEIFIMGGSLFYAQAMKYVNRLYLTIVDGDYKTEEVFPRYDSFARVLHTEKGTSGKYSYTFTILEK